MSGDPMPSNAVAGALGEHRQPSAGHRFAAADHPRLYTRVIQLCRLVGEERFFSAAFSPVRPEHECGAPGAGGGETWVVELDFEEVLNTALSADVPGPAEPR
ncbi:hypothetical protein [Sphaerisporangium fuscum]|uniref:hypothetical protein n=1 Tax=Sphaerisporangium fuscum TaxID=2835868 RepID=UPI001BDD58ED|nr:hypothetical protein [Sphaerisporangium fuscum]